ncbi:hypothetical protein EK21DRAFT_86023 [Setomelanomma holmii]|uniref:Uncharacterized protein n=1 Tax=Setomelanomma holmii TaxID=210430 RepID=A0A9P4LNI4_9PLEO|nr:hypothetical protein EK21DRAFT_86023 [Setomelanomma holmii]
MSSRAMVNSRKRSADWENNYDDKHKIKRARETVRQETSSPPPPVAETSRRTAIHAPHTKTLDTTGEKEEDSDDDQDFEDVLISGLKTDVAPTAAAPCADEKSSDEATEPVAGLGASAGDIAADPSSDDGDAIVTNFTKHIVETRILETYLHDLPGAGHWDKASRRKQKWNDMTPEQRYALDEEKKRDKKERDVKGCNQGEVAPAPSPEKRQFDSDEAIAEGDPYFAKGCKRRIVFSSDEVPNKYQYALWESEGMKRDPPHEFLTAIDKAFNWMSMRPITEPCHFILKVGALNGFRGHPNKLADRLNSMWTQYFKIKRWVSAYVTIELQFPHPHPIATVGYFQPFTSALLNLTDKKKLGHRLTIQLAIHADTHTISGPDSVARSRITSTIRNIPPNMAGNNELPEQKTRVVPEVERLCALATQTARRAVDRAKAKYLELNGDPDVYAPWAQEAQAMKWQDTFESVYKQCFERLRNEHFARIRAGSWQHAPHVQANVDVAPTHAPTITGVSSGAINQLQPLAGPSHPVQTWPVLPYDLSKPSVNHFEHYGGATKEPVDRDDEDSRTRHDAPGDQNRTLAIATSCGEVQTS